MWSSRTRSGSPGPLVLSTPRRESRASGRVFVWRLDDVSGGEWKDIGRKHTLKQLRSSPRNNPHQVRGPLGFPSGGGDVFIRIQGGTGDAAPAWPLGFPV